LFRVILQVAALDAAQPFYERLLGVTGRAVGGGRLYFDCGPVILALLEPSGEGGGAPQPNVDCVYFATDELEAVYQRARELGCLDPGTIHGEAPAGKIVVRPWGERSFYAIDPFGNHVCFVDQATIFTGREASSSH
jgi:catechol 2,3-dioxygenase-like lactoylglutathione lyase family enzyme